MSFVHSKGFKYFKNLIIGLGAAVVLMGALFKIQSWPYASEMLTAGLVTEAVLFALLGIIGPEKDYYWEKLYPGLDNHNSAVSPLAATGGGGAAMPGLNGEVVEQQLGGMLTELQGMSKSLGSLKALQDVDFSGTGEQLKTMNNFYTRLNEAMADLTDSADEARIYKDQMSSLNRNLGSLNSVYGNMLNAMSGPKA